MTVGTTLETPEAAYHALLSLTQSAQRVLEQGDATERRSARATGLVLLGLAERAARHPLLKPFRDDPMRTLDGQFPSVDAYLQAIVDFRAQIVATMSSESAATRNAVGSIVGALFLPAARCAVSCSIFAACDAPSPNAGNASAVTPAAAPLTRWPAPSALRPVSEAVARSAQSALRAAVLLLEQCDLPRPLWPIPLYYDLRPLHASDDDDKNGAEEEDDSEWLLAEVAGDSLGLPLALAFVSALSNAALRGDVAATGAVGRYEAEPLRLLPVSEIAEKREALPAFVRLFLTPNGSDDNSANVDMAIGSCADSASASATIALLATLWEAVRHALALPESLPARRASSNGNGTGESGAATDPASSNPPPAGDIMFLLADVEASARLWNQHPALMQSVTEAWRELVQEATMGAGGHLFRESSSDDGGFGAAFTSGARGCAAALELQRRVVAHPWPAALGSEWSPRVALHHGAAPRVGAEYGGPVVAQGRCLLSACHAGQILLSQSAYESVSALKNDQDDGKTQPSGSDWQWKELGTHQLRDLAAPMPLFQLTRPGLRADFEPPRTLDARRHNLPMQVSALIGRESEMVLPLTLLREGRSRLVTLTGPGGVGKTRLALAVATECLSDYPDGVWFVSLAEAQNDGLIGALEGTLRHARLLNDGFLGKDGILHALAQKRVLLLLDNCETCLDDAAFVSDLLHAAPHVVCLATSRAILNLQGEVRVEVAPLALPAPADEVATLASSSSVQLFVDRARAARQDFAPSPLSEADWRAVAAICRRVDGLPLAVELAAAHVRMLSLDEIERRMAHDFDLLTTRLRDVPPRHRGVRATLLWSHDMLEPAERRLFHRLCVFPGSFDSAAARAVNENSPQTEDLLSRLEENSLVSCRIVANRSRYSMLSMIREFGTEQLQERGDAEVSGVRERHARHFVARADSLSQNVNEPGEADAFNRMEAEMDNFRAACAFLQERAPSLLPQYVVTVADFLKRRGYWRERSEWLALADAIANSEPHREQTSEATRSAIWLHIGNLHMMRHDLEEADRYLLRAADNARRIGELRILGEAVNLRGIIARRFGRPKDAIVLHNEARELAQSIGNGRIETSALNNSASAALTDGDIEGALASFHESLQLCEQRDDQRGICSALTNLGYIADQQNRLPQAFHYNRRALNLARELKDKVGIVIPLLNMGDTLRQMGHIESAVPLLVAAEALLTRMNHGNAWHAADYLRECADLFGNERIETLRQEYARLDSALLENADRLVRPNLVESV